MSMIDEAMLVALCDGELDEVNRRRVERAVAEDPVLAKRLAAHRALHDRLAGHYAPVAEEPVPDHLRAVLEQGATVVPLSVPVRPRWRNWAAGGAIAASLVIGLGIGRVSGGSDGPIGMRNGAMVAQKQLASALDTQLASAPDGPVRIGLSFRRQGGGWCRSFEGADVAGVACREGADWRVQQAVPGHGAPSAYRQAASGDARVMATIEALIEGEPADAGQEAAAKAAGWK